MNVVLLVLWLLVTIGLVVFTIRPRLFTKLFKRTLTRLKLGLLFGALFMGLGMAVGATAPPSTQTNAHTAAKQPVATKAITKPKPTPKTQPKAAAAPVKPKPVLKGIGENDTQWNATHTADNQFTKGSAYDPMPNSIYGDASKPNNTDKYVGAVHQYGVITDYNISLNQGVSQSQAQSIAMAEMPTDATILTSAQDTQQGCYLITLHSDLLASDLATNDSQNQGGIIIELDTVSSNSLNYDANSVNAMDIRLANYPSGTSAPACFM